MFAFDRFQLINRSICERVHYLQFELIKGDSDEMAAIPAAEPRENKIRHVPIQVDCGKCKFLNAVVILFMYHACAYLSLNIFLNSVVHYFHLMAL